MKEEVDNSTIITLNNRTIKQKYNKEIEDLNKVINQQNLTDSYKTFHSTKTEYIFFSSIYGTFSTIDHILGHKTSLNKFIRIKLLQSTFSDHME